MSSDVSFLGQATKLGRSVLVDLPIAAVRRGLGRGERGEVAGTAWRGYDAAARLAETSLERLYASPLFAELVARGLDAFFLTQATGIVLARAIVRQVLPAPDEAYANELALLRKEVAMLRQRLDREPDERAAA